MTLAEFLLARIAEDERASEGAGRIAWVTIRDKDGRMVYTTVAAQTIEDDPDYWVADGRGFGAPSDSAVTTDTWQVSVVYDERRARAECEAKRAIIQTYADAQPSEFPNFEGGYLSALENVLLLLTLPYATHPDYREEWKL